MAKIRLKRLLHEIHSRSVWQVLSVYVAGSWGVLQAVEMVQGATGLPDWILPSALVLLLIGLPVVLATAVIQGGPQLPGHQESSARGEPATGPAIAKRDTQSADAESPTRFFTWRNTLLGGAGAAAVWVLLAAGWFARDYLAGGANGAGDLDIPLAAAAESGARLGAAVLRSDSDSVARDGETGLEEDAPAAADTTGSGDDDRPGAPAPPAPPTDREETVRRPAAGERERTADPAPSNSRIERARTVFLTARMDADAARRAAGAMRAGEAVPGALARADSSWNAGDVAAAAGRYADAARLMEMAGERFAAAEREARAEWRARIDTVATSLPALREAADPTEPRHATAGERERDGERLAAAGQLPEAAAAFAEAAELYREIPRPAAPDPSPADTGAPADPSPREIVETTLGELARALAAEDLARVRAVWVSLTEEQAHNFSTFFRRWEHIDVSFDPDWGSLDATPGEITVTVYTTWRFMEGGQAREQPPFQQMFRIIERDSRWVILDG